MRGATVLPVVVLPRGSLILPRQRILLDFRARILFYPIFGGSFGGLPESKWVMRHIVGKLSCPLSNDIKFARIGFGRGSYGPGSRGVGAVFVHKIPERLCARRRLSGRKNAFCSQRVFFKSSQFARIFDLAPDVDFDVLGTVGKLALPICKVPDLRKSELDFEIWPRERPPGVFGPFEGVFRSGFRLTPINSWRSESSLS
uniref:Uncharacterized protein n=1 Tax=Fagus sylvatica TaxID=28930 RepID=A0A2N9ED68_FAGSY